MNKKECDFCDGTGECYYCKGTGSVQKINPHPYPNDTYPICKGNGVCPYCNGTGKVDE